MRIGVSFRRFASGFCRASQSVADYYTTQVAGRLHVGSGVQFPSIERLTNARERTLAEKELEVRLRCDYELTYGSGAHVAPQRPSFDEWRMATLQRHYGNGWRQIDLSRLPAQDSASSRSDWNVVSIPLQE